jgi:hypothetical protein
MLKRQCGGSSLRLFEANCGGPENIAILRCKINQENGNRLWL